MGIFKRSERADAVVNLAVLIVAGLALAIPVIRILWILITQGPSGITHQFGLYR